MRTRKALLAALAAGLLVVPLTPGGPAAASPPTAVVAPGAASSHTITLVTGDRITVTGDGDLMVHRSGGRDGITFLAHRSGGHQYVIPSDALGLVRGGQLDRRLFDVSLLREFGYDDRRHDLPLIVTGRGAPTALEEAAGGTDLPAVDGVAAQVDKARLGELWDDMTDPVGATDARTLAAGVSTVWLDGLRQPVLDESVPQVGAPAAHAAGLDGTGATVAVLDTGIDVTHPDLADRVVESANFTEGEEDDLDRVGHGTHVASILAGTGAASAGQFQGVAPGTSLLNGKVCVEFGCAESWLLAGMQWAAEQGADVVSMSLGGSDTPGLDPLEEAVEMLTAEFGALFVIAAGNEGGFAPVSSPASAPAAVAVGAVDKSDQLAGFSSRGPSVDDALKPDLTAPGVEITAANSKDGFLGEPGEPYTTIDGTSMSTPHVAGAAAILVQQHPEWTPAQLKAALMGSASPSPEVGPYAQGAGRLDVAQAVAHTVTADPPSVGFERPLWPHGDDEPQAQTVTYVNGGDTDTTLELALSATGPDGEPAPDGFFSLDTTTVTVPAGGSAAVTITADTSIGEVDGLFGGYLTATGTDTVVTTAFAVHREVESYDVTLPHTDRDGAPTTAYLTSLIRRDAGEFVDIFGSEATPTVRVPAGEYTLMSFVSPAEPVEDEFAVALLAHPRLVVDGDLTLPVDAREAEPISVTVPDTSAAPTLGAVSASVTTEENGAGFVVLADSFDDVTSGQLGPDQTVDGFDSGITSAWARPNPDDPDAFAATPYTYDLTWFEVGRMVTGFARDVAPGDLATIRAAHAHHVPGVEGWKSSAGYLPGVVEGATGVILPEPTPFRRTEYHNTDGGVVWAKSFEENLVDFEEEIFESFSFAESPPIGYQAGRTYREQWNQGVFGPVLPDCAAFLFPCPPVLSRDGDELEIAPRPYGDSAGRQLFRPVDQTITVYRNGEQIAQVPDPGATVEVPPERATYRVEVSAETGDQRIPLSTSVDVAWTFRSGHLDGPEPLPVSVVRFTPRLDQHNTAPAGRGYVIPVDVQGQPGSDAAKLKRLTVAVSFDDGASWRRVPVIAGRFALVDHPAEAGFVSLRASATDRAGNTVEQTVIRAYAIG